LHDELASVMLRGLPRKQKCATSLGEELVLEPAKAQGRFRRGDATVYECPYRIRMVTAAPYKVKGSMHSTNTVLRQKAKISKHRLFNVKASCMKMMRVLMRVGFGFDPILTLFVIHGYCTAIMDSA
jgi:hypothetical protein